MRSVRCNWVNDSPVQILKINTTQKSHTQESPVKPSDKWTNSYGKQKQKTNQTKASTSGQNKQKQRCHRRKLMKLGVCA